MVDIVYGYVRVSSEKQEKGFGPEIQETAIRKYCVDKNLPEPSSIIHDTETGKNDDRPGITKLYNLAAEHAKDGNTPHCVLYRMDRLSRILMHIDQRISRAVEIGLRLHSCQPGEESYFDPELTKDPSIKFTRQIMSAVIEYERALIQMRLDGGLAKVDAKGGYTGGTAPFGYKLVDKDLVIDRELVPVVCAILKHHEAGISLRAIAAELKIAFPGVRKWSAATVSGIIKRKRMYTEGLYEGRLGGKTIRPELTMIQEKKA